MSGRANQTGIVDSLADALMAEFGRRQSHGMAGNWARYAGVQDRTVIGVYDVEVAALLRRVPGLKKAVEEAWKADASGKLSSEARDELVGRLDHELHNGQSHTRLSLEALLGVSDRVVATDEPAGTTVAHGARRQRWRLNHQQRGRSPEPAPRSSVGRVVLPLLLLNGIIATTLAAGPALNLVFGTPPPPGDARVIALSACGVWALAFLPGWLFVRFLDRRAAALWDEYVIHLYRLGVDDPGNLPEPPRTSSYHDDWVAHGGLGRLWIRSVYREKFDAYYGRSVSRVGIDPDSPVKPEALFPVFLCTGVLAVAWTAIFYDPQRSLGSAAQPTIWTALTFGFMGAYVFFLQMLMRRYFQTDLRAGAYISGYVRTVVALLVVTVLYAAMPDPTSQRFAVVVAFGVGWFPTAGLQWLLRVASRRLRAEVPSLVPAYPLNRLDGLNIWYEARLVEEGIEDLQNLVTANLVDVILHTRVPVARLVDWIDQALLLIHLPPEPAVHDKTGLTYKKRSEKIKSDVDDHPRQHLRKCGVRSATGLLRALPRGRDQAEKLLDFLDKQKLPRSALLSLRAVLAAERRLGVVYNWQSGDPRPPARLPLGTLPDRVRASGNGATSALG